METQEEAQQDETLKYLVHQGVQATVGGAMAVAAWQKLFKLKDYELNATGKGGSATGPSAARTSRATRIASR